jgi:mRNA interferase MazF
VAGFPLRGEIYWVDFSPTIGSEQDGHRPAVVVSNDIGNRHSSVVIVVPMTSKLREKDYPQDVRLEAGDPLPEAGRILCAQVRAVAKERLENRIAALNSAQLHAVDEALRTALRL